MGTAIQVADVVETCGLPGGEVVAAGHPDLAVSS
jgi:hypothetical protein